MRAKLNFHHLPRATTNSTKQSAPPKNAFCQKKRHGINLITERADFAERSSRFSSGQKPFRHQHRRTALSLLDSWLNSQLFTINTHGCLAGLVELPPTPPRRHPLCANRYICRLIWPIWWELAQTERNWSAAQCKLIRDLLPPPFDAQLLLLRFTCRCCSSVLETRAISGLWLHRSSRSAGCLSVCAVLILGAVFVPTEWKSSST